MKNNLMVMTRELVNGDSVELPDGGSVRLVILDDDCWQWQDYAEELYGKVCHVDDVRRNNTWGREQRPLWADGAARKINAGRECYWWQPADDIKADPELIRKTVKVVRDLLEFGWQHVIVEILDADTDAYGDPIVRETDSMGGVEWATLTDDDRAGLVADILVNMDSFRQVTV
jgi:hypothetical protein